MKNLFLLAFLSVFLISCEPLSPEAKKAFIGEYWMETSSVGMYQGKAINACAII